MGRLQAVEQAEFGGVDSRSNPITLPPKRFLLLRNWLPRPDGHLELREGYTAQPVGDDDAGVGAIHSMSPYTVSYPGVVADFADPSGLPFPNASECVFFWRGTVPYVRWLDGGINPTATPPIRGNAIMSSARWQYALGKDGYLYMHNGTDMKFFDGLFLRDIGLPTLTQAQVSAIVVAVDFSGPDPTDLQGAVFSWVAPTDSPPTQANAVGGQMFEAFFDKSNDVVIPGEEPLGGGTFQSGHDVTNTLGYDSSWLHLASLPLPTKGGAIGLLYYPGGHAQVTLQPGAVCNFYARYGGGSYNSQFEYSNASDTYGGGQPLPSPATTPFDVPTGYGLMFNPEEPIGFPNNFKPWDSTMPINGHIYPMVVADVTNGGQWGGHTTVIWSGATGPGSGPGWTMTVEGTIAIPAAGDYDFIFVHDDGAIIGFGDGATPVTGYVDPALQQLTAVHGYAVSVSRGSAGYHSDPLTVSFPTAGVFHFEIDYCNWESAQTCCLYNGDGSAIVPGTAAPFQVPTPSFITTSPGLDGGTLSFDPTQPGIVNVHLTGHLLASGNVVVLSFHKSTFYASPPGADYVTPITPPTVPWRSNGPFTITFVDADNFTFRTSEAALYDGATPITIMQLVELITTTYTIDTDNSGWPFTAPNGIDTNQNGEILLPGPFDASVGLAGNVIPASAIGGAQPGYLFYVSVYNPLTGHVGNRVPIGVRENIISPSTFLITGLPDLSAAFSGKQLPLWGNGTEPWLPPLPVKPKQGTVVGNVNSPGDTEWRLLIGRTGDGGEVPYAIIDAFGNWVFTQAANSPSISIDYANIDGNSELPTLNFIPPAFVAFWREGDRLCGAIDKQPFVYRSASELDATTGIFVGDTAQSWDPAKVETFPTAKAIIGGFGYMQESWVFTKGHVGQLSELSGEVAWNGPYNFGIIGAHAFDQGWNGLPFWISHEKQLVTMPPNSNGPIPISTEYEATLLQRIGDAYAAETEVVYFRDPARLVEVLRIKCVDNSGAPFVVIHDFNLRDEQSPFGQAYEDDYQSTLATDFTSIRVLDDEGNYHMWAGASDSLFYQFYAGGDDNGVNFTADGISLRYVSGERAAVKTVEWYGDEQIVWYSTDRLTAVANADSWEKLSDQYRPFPGDEGNAHYQTDLQTPEVIHLFLWVQLTSHPADAPDPTNPMALSVPPHMPLETYGRLYLAAPLIGDTRGR